ncbi:hypothetical protein CDQ91_07650 [Sphingopyxis witflariensis]|uniref:Uncharacterized protein n=1 Tax=Sphingopyxis witflariensis TaxID=173675 RepID=A0A246K0H0_9SPHN|nr:hypothetical protein CDQ91_07650 [Sphingopyxis witflariensis]
MTVHASELMRKLSKKIDQRRSIQLSADDLDYFVASGAWDALCKSVLEYQRNQCQERSAQNRSTSAEITNSIDDQTARTLRSSGTTTRPDANVVLADVQAMFGKAARR